MLTRITSALGRMRGRPVESYSKLRLGSIAVAGLIIVLSVTVFVNSRHFGQDTYRAQFAQAAGIASGDGVTTAGVPVGTVTGVRLDGDRVVVTMKIDDDVPMGGDTKAAIKLTTLLGTRYVELRPSGTGELPGKVIPLANTEVPYDLQSALQNATTTFSQVDADQIGRSMTVLSAQLKDTPALVPEVLRNINGLASVIAARRGQIGALLTSTAEVTSVIKNQQADLGALVEEGRTLFQQLVSRRNALEGMLNATTTLVHQLEPIAVDDRPEIEGLLANLTSMMGMMSAHDDLLRNTLQVLPLPWRLWANLTGTGPELVGNAQEGALISSFMCALSGRAEQVNLKPYLEGCE